MAHDGRWQGPAQVKAVDTTRAEDAFVGAFALATAWGLELRQSVEVANAAAAVSVTSFGAADPRAAVAGGS